MEAAIEFVNGLNAFLASITALVVTTAGLLWAVLRLHRAVRSWRRRQVERNDRQALQQPEQSDSQDAAAGE